MKYFFPYDKTGTNSKGIDKAVEKAIARAEWYKENYRGAKDFEKRYIKQFWTVISTFKKKHEFTTEQEVYLQSKIPPCFSSILFRSRGL